MNGEKTFTVKTESFEGPLDLLLSLVEKRKLFINEISLAGIVDDYVAYVKSAEKTIPPSSLSHFLVVAATLLLIKSRSLLPVLSLTPEEEGDIRDLEKRLHIYKAIRAAAEKRIRPLWGKRRIFLRRPAFSLVVFAPDKDTNVSSLHAAVSDMVRRLPRNASPKETVSVKKAVTLEEMIDRLQKRMESALRTTFREFTAGAREKVELVVGFLAMLELVKQGCIEVSQGERFGDIAMESRMTDTPRYVQ